MRMMLARGMTGILSDTVETLLLLRPMIRPISMFCLSWKSLSWPSTSYSCTKRIGFHIVTLELGGQVAVYGTRHGDAGCH